MQLQKSWREIDLLWWYVHFLSSLEIDDRIGAYDDLGELLTSDTSLSTYVTIGNITLLNPKFSDWGIFSILFRRKNNKIWYLFQIWKACSFEMKNICEIEIKTNGMNFPLWILIGKFETFSKKKTQLSNIFKGAVWIYRQVHKNVSVVKKKLHNEEYEFFSKKIFNLEFIWKKRSQTRRFRYLRTFLILFIRIHDFQRIFHSDFSDSNSSWNLLLKTNILHSNYRCIRVGKWRGIFLNGFLHFLLIIDRFYIV